MHSQQWRNRKPENLSQRHLNVPSTWPGVLPQNQMGGGLRLYHPARCIYGNPKNNPCLTKRDASGFEFRFMGGPPGWEVLGLPPTVESIVLIAPNGRSVIAESYQDIS